MKQRLKIVEVKTSYVDVELKEPNKFDVIKEAYESGRHEVVKEITVKPDRGHSFLKDVSPKSQIFIITEDNKPLVHFELGYVNDEDEFYPNLDIRGNIKDIVTIFKQLEQLYSITNPKGSNMWTDIPKAFTRGITRARKLIPELDEDYISYEDFLKTISFYIRVDADDDFLQKTRELDEKMKSQLRG